MCRWNHATAPARPRSERTKQPCIGPATRTQRLGWPEKNKKKKKKKTRDFKIGLRHVIVMKQHGLQSIKPRVAMWLSALFFFSLLVGRLQKGNQPPAPFPSALFFANVEGREDLTLTWTRVSELHGDAKTVSTEPPSLPFFSLSFLFRFSFPFGTSCFLSLTPFSF